MSSFEIEKKCPFCQEPLKIPYSNCPLCGWNKEILEDLFTDEKKFEKFGKALVQKLIETNVNIKILGEKYEKL